MTTSAKQRQMALKDSASCVESMEEWGPGREVRGCFLPRAET